MNIAHTDLKPGDRFRLAEVEGPDENGLTRTSVREGTVHRVDADRVFYGPDYYSFLTDHDNATWERISPAEPKNLGAVVEFTDPDYGPARAVRVGESFENDNETYYWDSILRIDANPRVLHEGWDDK